jgi:hypothetical protein
VGDLSLVSLVTSGFKNSRLEVLPHRGEDLFLTLGPDEGLGVVVPVVKKKNKNEVKEKEAEREGK